MRSDRLSLMGGPHAKGTWRFAWGRFNPLARFVTLNVLGSAASLCIGFVASIGLARWLGPSGRGLLGVMLSASGLALALASTGLPLSVIYFASRSDSEPEKILGNSLLYAAVLTAVFIPAGFFLYGPLARAFGHGQGGMNWIIAAALVPIVFLDWTTHGQLQGMTRFGRFNALLVISRIAYVLVIVVLLGVFSFGVTGGLIATGAASLVMIAGSLGPLLQRGAPRVDTGLIRRMLNYGSRVQIGSIFQLTNARLDVVIMQFYRPLSQVGYYVVAQGIAELMMTLARAFQSSVLPLVSRGEGTERQAATSIDSIRHYAILATAALLANALLGPVVIYYAFGSQYRAAIVPMLILLPGVWFLGVGTVIQGDLGGRGRPGTSSKLAGIAAAVTVVLDLTLIPPFGVIGAALASVAAYTTFGVASLIVLHRVSEVPLRELVLPTRRDLGVYSQLARDALARLRGGARDRP